MRATNPYQVYLPSELRNNHYIVAQFQLYENGLSHSASLKKILENIAEQFFSLCEENGLLNVQMLINNKQPIVRFGYDAFTVETDKAVLFFYNPEIHESYKAFIDPESFISHVTVVFLATGKELRSNAALFHNEVQNTLSEFRFKSGLEHIHFEVNDFQHLTYDLFAREKSAGDSYGYKLRTLTARYSARHCELPKTATEIAYATFKIDINKEVRRFIEEHYSKEGEKHFLEEVEELFILACRLCNLKNYRVKAGRDLTSLKDIETEIVDSKSQRLTDLNGPILINSSEREAHHPSVVHFVMVATQADIHEKAYAKFLSSAEKVVHFLTNKLPIDTQNMPVLMRFHQSVNYRL